MKFKSFILIIVLMFVYITNSIAEEKILYPYKDNITGKYGYIDNNGKVVINPKYEFAGIFNNGVARINVYPNDQNYNLGGGFIDLNNRIIYQSPNYKNKFNGWGAVEDFKNNMAIVQIWSNDGSEKYGYINNAGKVVIPFKYDRVYNFNEGYAVAINNLNNKIKIVLIDNRGRENNIFPQFLTEKGFDDISKSVGFYSDGLLAIRCSNNKYGFMDIKGKFIISPKYDSCFNDYESKLTAPYFIRGKSFVQMNSSDDGSVNPKVYMIDRMGKVLKEYDCETISDFSDGIAIMYNGGNHVGAIDTNGNILFENKDNKKLGNFSDGLCAYYDYHGDGKGYLDKTGKAIIILQQYKSIGPFIGGLAEVERNNGNKLYIDKKGKVVFEQ